jgi:glyoxylase-like metal-dependent hydrolase (beta-lactamase superfamily II)
MQEVYQDIYLIKLPLPQNPLKNLNSYLIKGACGDRSLLIDTGFNHPETEAALMAELKEANVRLEEMDVFITHCHSDHSGLAGKLKNDHNTVYSSSRDGVLIRDHVGDHFWRELVKQQRFMGFPYKFLHTDHPGFRNKNENQYDRVSKDPGDTLKAGCYKFEVIDLSGHTPGQIGLYEKKHRILFSGDHLLHKITPNMKFWNFDYDCLGDYLSNLKKMNDLDVEHLYSAHRELIPDMRARIGQMLAHHERRLDTALEVISKEPCNAWTVASGIVWDYLGGDFTKFPPPQQWFAANETFVHLEHLFASRKDIKRQAEGDVFFYSTK